MESTDKPAPESGKTAPEPTATREYSAVDLLMVDLSLRILLFAATLTAVVVMVTSKQTKFVPYPKAVKFSHSPALIYFVVALSVACLYSIITSIGSFWAIWKPCPSKKLLFHFLLIDVLMVGVVASATGTSGAVAYIGLKGNSHVGWIKVCSIYSKFCRHIGSSTVIALFASILLVLLVMLSAYSLHRRSC